MKGSFPQGTTIVKTTEVRLGGGDQGRCKRTGPLAVDRSTSMGSTAEMLGATNRRHNPKPCPLPRDVLPSFSSHSVLESYRMLPQRAKGERCCDVQSGRSS